MSWFVDNTEVRDRFLLRSGDGRGSATLGFEVISPINYLFVLITYPLIRMVHWRSSEMQPFQAHPERQFAFILNLDQHWFTIRRFGVVAELENATAEEAEGCHWFNLNSSFDAPEWISRTFLGMILQQAESEGNAVPFALLCHYDLLVDRIFRICDSAD